MTTITRTARRWGARGAVALTAGALAVTLLPATAHAAVTLPDPTIVGGNDKVIAGTTVQVSFPPFAGLPAGTEPANRTTHVAIVRSKQDCIDLRFTHPVQSQGVPFADLKKTIVREYAIPSKANDPQIETLRLCAWQIGIAPFDAPATLSHYVILPIKPNPAGAGVATFPLPGTPSIVGGTTPTGVPVGGSVRVSAGLLSPPSGGDRLSLRQLRRSVVARADADTCASGSNLQTWDLLAVGYNANDALVNVPVPGGTVGKYLCIDQLTATAQSPIIRTSTPALALITAAAPPPAVNLAQAATAVQGALSRVQEATRNLNGLLANPQANQQEVAAAIEEAQQAQEELQGAQAAAAVADPANAVNQQGDAGGVIANTPNQQQADAANSQVREQLAAALGASTVAVSPTSNPTLLSLATATGFDPLVTPVLGESTRNKAGISLKVSKPRKITRRKGFSVTLNVAPKTTRGGMRQYLLQMDGDQPTLLHKRSGFITTGARAKKYWISPKAPKGTYLLLSTFTPSVPGTPGLSIATPLTVR